MSRDTKTPINNNALPKDKMRLAIIASLGVLTLLIAIGLIAYFTGKQEGQKNARFVPIISAKTGETVKGISIQSYNGQIVSTEKGKITFLTSVRQNDNSVVQKNIVAVLSAKTELAKLNLTKPIAPQDQSTAKESLSLSELKKGDYVVIQSEDDITTHSEITAKTVSLLITPGSK